MAATPTAAESSGCFCPYQATLTAHASYEIASVWAGSLGNFFMSEFLLDRQSLWTSLSSARLIILWIVLTSSASCYRSFKVPLIFTWIEFLWQRHRGIFQATSRFCAPPRGTPCGSYLLTCSHTTRFQCRSGYGDCSATSQPLYVCLGPATWFKWGNSTSRSNRLTCSGNFGHYHCCGCGSMTLSWSWAESSSKCWCWTSWRPVCLPVKSVASLFRRKFSTLLSYFSFCFYKHWYCVTRPSRAWCSCKRHSLILRWDSILVKYQMGASAIILMSSAQSSISFLQ